MNNSIFKPVRISERLKELKEKFDSKCIFNHEEKTLTYKGDVGLLEYNILLKFYKDYTVDINGNIYFGYANLCKVWKDNKKFLLS